MKTNVKNFSGYLDMQRFHSNHVAKDLLQVALFFSKMSREGLFCEVVNACVGWESKSATFL